MLAKDRNELLVIIRSVQVVKDAEYNHLSFLLAVEVVLELVDDFVERLLRCDLLVLLGDFDCGYHSWHPHQNRDGGLFHTYHN